ncbi:unnamed protein product, partial [Allacma fusca]
SFKDSDGDGVGDIKGITSKLDYFVDLGIDAIWISPMYSSPMKDFGYDISNFTNIDPIFGTLEDFYEMATEFKKRDIKLIMDIVPNHSSDLHEWFVKSVQRIEPYTNYYVWKNATGFDEEGKPLPPNNWVSVFGADVRQLLDIYSKVDGKLRCMMVESSVSDDYIMQYYGTRDKPVAHFPFNFHLLSVRPDHNARQVLEAINIWYDLLPEGQWATFLLGNHDQKRAPTRWSEVLAFTRILENSNALGYLVLVNLSDDVVNVDASTFDRVPAIGSVINTQTVELGARNSVIIAFPPL